MPEKGGYQGKGDQCDAAPPGQCDEKGVGDANLVDNSAYVGLVLVQNDVADQVLVGQGLVAEVDVGDVAHLQERESPRGETSWREKPRRGA